ncbi:MAG: PASTA domain-containing protein, partial [Clostridia bacterium]|nr:PASTA domain-containing protein [Clostridia bacterium]
AHSRGLIHRDIKPHNIMILKDGSVKVADFGIAHISSAQNTLTREALGSVHYISPEQAKGAHTDFRSDLYSLGVVMYEMLTGRPPFDGDTPVSVAIQHINAKATMPREINPSIPEGLEQITMHAMTAEIAKRYSSASLMLADLEDFRKNPNIVFDFSGDNAGIDVDRLISDPNYMPPDLSAEGTGGVVRKKIVKKPAQPADEKTASDESRNGRHIAVITGTVCIILAVFGIIWFLYSYFISDLFKKTEEDFVPRFIGMNIENIRDSDYPNFKIDVVAWKPSDTMESGCVIDQNPEPDRQVKVGSTVELTVSIGTDSNIMPNLVNLPLANAQSYLSTMPIQVSVTVVYETSDVFTDGYVMRTEPEYKEKLSVGQTVTLVVCSGPEIKLVEVPTLIGHLQEQALKEIKECGLADGPLTFCRDDAPKGTVIYQSINPGEQVKEGTVINMQVSLGPEEAEQPFIRTLSADAKVEVGDSLQLFVDAMTTDDGVLTYAWYVSKNGSTDNATLISRSSEHEKSCKVDTSKAGTFYYFCRIVNTLGVSTSTINSQMIEVVVEEPVKETTKTISIELPQAPGSYHIAVKINDADVITPFSVDLTEEETHTTSVSVTSTGTQTVDIYVNGILQESRTIDFSTED